jgi:hypothetical protein
LRCIQLPGDKSATINVSYGGIPVGVPAYTIVLALFIVFGGAMASTEWRAIKAWWLMPVVAITSLRVQPADGYVADLYGVVPGRSSRADSWVLKFVQSLFNAGLRRNAEGVPVAIGVYIGISLLGRFRPVIRRQLAVIEPLDGI